MITVYACSLAIFVVFVVAMILIADRWSR